MCSLPHSKKDLQNCDPIKSYSIKTLSCFKDVISKNNNYMKMLYYFLNAYIAYRILGDKTYYVYFDKKKFVKFYLKSIILQ